MVDDRPIAFDLFCGLGGWAEGLLATGWRVIGFDVEHRFIGRYPGELVLQDVLTICGRRQFRGKGDLIVASPPCTEPSYRAMPWKRAKALNAEGPPHKFIELFNACFRIAEEAGLPLIVENVKGAQPWVGSAKWHYGSFYLWGDVPALMPPIKIKPKGAGGGGTDPREASRHSLRSDAIKQHGTGAAWFDQGFTRFPSRSERRREASALDRQDPVRPRPARRRGVLPELTARNTAAGAVPCSLACRRARRTAPRACRRLWGPTRPGAVCAT